jgi:hypothetical protein
VSLVALAACSWLLAGDQSAPLSSPGVPERLACAQAHGGILDYFGKAQGNHDPLELQAKRWLAGSSVRLQYRDLRVRIAERNAKTAVAVLEERSGAPRAVLTYARADDQGWLLEYIHSC